MSPNQPPAQALARRALAALDSAYDAVVCVDERGRVAGFNPRATELLGWAEETALGADAVAALVPRGASGGLEADLARALADPQAEPVRVERPVLAAGRTIVAEVTITPAVVDGERMATLFLRDVTARHRAEELREVEHRLARLLAAARSGAEVARQALELVGAGLRFDHAELWKADAHGATLRLSSAWRRRQESLFGEAGRRLVLGRGEDLAGAAMELGETVCCDDPASLDGFVRGEAAAADGIRGCAALPIVARGRVAAVAVLAREGGEPIDHELRRTLRTLAAQLGQFAERRAAERQLAEETVALAAVARATRRLTAAVEERTVREAIVEAALEVSGAAYAFLALPDAEHGGLVVRAAAPDAVLADHRFGPDASSAVMRAFVTRRPVFVSDVESDPQADRASGQEVGVVSGMLQPILRDEDVLGVLGVGWRTRQATFDGSARLLVSLVADEAAMALARAALVGQLESAARTDPLTGLANLRAWEEQLSRELAASGRDGRPVAIAVLDLDGLKLINDSQGHQAGDRILRCCAAAWQGQLRDGDLLARLGGDEFAALLPGCRREDALLLAHRLRSATVDSTASVGVADWDGEESPAALMARADAALYAAKSEGRDRVASR